MAKASVTVPSRSYQPGTRTVVLPDLTADDNGVQITLTRESWPATGGDILSGTVEGSDDAGATWYELTRFSYPGGDQINPRTGQPVLTCGPTAYWPERTINGVAVPQRPGQVRAVVSNTVTLTTGITLSGV